MKFLPLILLTSTCLVDSAFAAPKKKTQSARKEALSAEEQLKTFKVPPGFVVELVASEENGLVNPIDLAFDDAGRLWTQTARMYPLDPLPKKVGRNDLAKVDAKSREFSTVREFYQLDKKGEDQILVISDPTQKVQGQIPVFAEGLAIPQSILPYKDGVFVAHGSEMLFLNDTDRDGKFDQHETILSGFGFFDTHTMSHTLVRGPGGWVHFSHGALNKGKVTAVKSGQQETFNFSKIGRFSLDGERLEVLNCGLQNIWGFHLKENGQWYGTEANDLGWSLTPMHPMMTYKGIGNDKFRDYQPIPPVFHTFRVGGTGISALAYDENGSKGFPKKWKNLGFLANPITSTINCVIADRKPDGSVISEHLEDFLSCSDDWFRPVNMEFGPDGCLYIVDWYNKIVSHNEVARTHPDRDKTHGRIWRVRHQSQPQGPIPNLTKTPNNELIKHLASEIQWEKRTAWHQIADRQAQELAPDLNKIVLDQRQSLSTRLVALWSLESLGAYDFTTLQALSQNKDPDLRREAVRSLATFQPRIEEVVSLVSPLINDPHYMVKEQVLRTLAEIGEANPDTIQLLITACVPAAKNNNWGEGYEPNFQRFLARKALEQYPTELAAFISSPAAKSLPPENLDWASKALEGDKLAQLFIDNWEKEGPKTLDGDGLVSISSQLSNRKVFALLAPQFETKEFVELALEVQPRLQSATLLKALELGLKKLFNSPATEDRNLAIETALRFNSPALAVELRKTVEALPLNQISAQWVNALAITPKENQATLLLLGQNEEVPRAIRLQALTQLSRVAPKEASSHLEKLVTPLSKEERESVATSLASSHYGSAMALTLAQRKLLSLSEVNVNTAKRISTSFPKNPMAKKLRAATQAKARAEASAADERLQKYLAAVERLQGNPTAGQSLFGATCLTCHAVGDQGLDIAPALDGSANRDISHLLTAIVKPNEAMEAGYRIYRVIKTNGDVLEGYMRKSNAYGVTLAFMGGGEFFVPKEQILKESAVNGESFMPSHFGNLPEQNMVDLVSYIQTLK
ncbi:MAG: PVC-type heme-binding CxxCH protein [Roseibacillus sp.]